MPSPISRPALLFRAACGAAFLGALYLFLLHAVVHTRGVWANDQGMKALLVQHLARGGLGDPALPYPAKDLDPEGRFSPLPKMFTWTHEGRSYSIFSHAYAALAVPFYRALGFPGLYLPSILGAAAAALAAALMARRAIPDLPPVLALLVAGLATPLAFYALVLWEHAFSTALLGGSLVALLAGLERSRRALFVASGVLAGIAFWMRLESAWFVPALAVAAWMRDRRSTAPILLGAALAVLPLLLYNARVFGHLLGPDVAFHYGSGESEFVRGFLETRGPILSDLLLDDATRPWLWIALAALAASWIFRRPALEAPLLLVLAAAATWGYLAPRPNAIHQDLWSSAPFVLLALAPLRGSSGAAAPALRTIRWTVALYVGAVSATAPNAGGAQFGPRYLLPAYVALAVLALAAVAERLRTRSGRALAAVAPLALLALSFLVQERGVRVLGEMTRRSIALLSAVEGQASDVVVADEGWFAQILGPVYLDRRVLLAESEEEHDALVALFRTRGVSRWTFLAVSEWGRNAAIESRGGLEFRPILALRADVILFDVAAR